LERLNDWNADELVYVDITREGAYDLKRDDLKHASRSDVVSILRDIATKCFMPLSFGGRVKTLADVDALIANGADKVVINSGVIENPSLITDVAEKYGAQAMVVAVDYRQEEDDWLVFSHSGTQRTAWNLKSWLTEAQKRGAGEIFLNAIHRDGLASGFDLESINRACEWVQLPVIACGGAGVVEDFIDVFEKTPVSAVAAGNFFNFTENAYIRVKKALRQAGINVR